jgi:predicted RNase H-like HicB family nuclease
MNVVALVHHENGAYGVSFPDFPGCTTVAADLDGAVAKAAEVLAFHVEGLAEDGPLPQVRGMSELERDPTFREDAEGALLVLVPYSPPTRAVRINITVDESLLARIDRAAEAEGETRSAYLANAAIARLGTVLERARSERVASGFSEQRSGAYRAKPARSGSRRRPSKPRARSGDR